MAGKNQETREHAHKLLDQLGAGQIAAVVRLLEVMVNPDDQPLTEEDRPVSASREWFKNNPEGIPLEQVAADCVLTMDEITADLWS